MPEQHVLKVLFGTNLVNNISTKAQKKTQNSMPNLYFFGEIKMKMHIFVGYWWALCSGSSSSFSSIFSVDTSSSLLSGQISFCSSSFFPLFFSFWLLYFILGKLFQWWNAVCNFFISVSSKGAYRNPSGPCLFF